LIPRVGLDLEPGVHIARVVPDLDLLDIAYGAVHGGAQIIMVPISAFVTSDLYTPQLFSRPGIPLFAVKTEIEDLDRVSALGNYPDRVVVIGERGHAVSDLSRCTDYLKQVTGSSQEFGVVCDPEPSALKELSRAKVQWAYFSTVNVFGATDPDMAVAEVAHITSAAVAAHHLKMRVALIGPTGKHLAPALAALPHLEEIYPAPDLWAMAMRSGWEGAVSEYRRILG
jgi:hypothetical protein